MAIKKVEAAQTYTIESFIACQKSDDMTYRNFSILENVGGLEFVDHNIIYDYLDELNSLCKTVNLTKIDMLKYRYAPDLLAFDVYGSTQLDFVILAANDMIDPKEFSLSSLKVKLPMNSILKEFLSSVYNAESSYINKNRSDISGEAV